MNENIKKFYDSLNEDVKGKLKACKSQNEMLKVLEDANITLDPELLKSVSGGGGVDCPENQCPPDEYGDLVWHGCRSDSHSCPHQGCDPANSVC